MYGVRSTQTHSTQCLQATTTATATASTYSCTCRSLTQLYLSTQYNYSIATQYIQSNNSANKIKQIKRSTHAKSMQLLGPIHQRSPHTTPKSPPSGDRRLKISSEPTYRGIKGPALAQRAYTIYTCRHSRQLNAHFETRLNLFTRLLPKKKEK